MAPKKENITNIEDKHMDLHVENTTKSIDIQYIIENGFDVRKDANDVIDIVAFMVQYDLDLVCTLLQRHMDGSRNVDHCFKEIEGMIRRENIDMDAIKIKLTRLAKAKDEKD